MEEPRHAHRPEDSRKIVGAFLRVGRCGRVVLACLYSCTMGTRMEEPTLAKGTCVSMLPQ